MSFGYRLCRRLRHIFQGFMENPEIQERGLANRNHLKLLNSKEVAQKCPDRLHRLLDEPPALLEKQIEYSWNPADGSSSLLMKTDQLTVYRSHVINCTSGIRGKVAFSEGLHVWKVYWPVFERGTNATIGVGTATAPINLTNYGNLVGNTSDSWGWDLINCKALHDATNHRPSRTYPMFDDTKETYQVPPTFFMVLDMDDGTLAFIAEGEYLGIAFDGLKGQTLYPFVGCVWGSCKITLAYMGGNNVEVDPLRDLCRRVIRQNINNENVETEINKMEIPKEVKSYILYKVPTSINALEVLKAIGEEIDPDAMMT